MNQPENLTKDRLKAELKKHGVSFQPHETKDYYVQLYRKEVFRGKGGRGRTVRSEFSSDEEFVRQSPRLAKKQMTKRVTKVGKSDTYISQVAQMTDKQLMEELRKFGEDPGPITDTTRGVYQRKLAKHLAEKPKVSSHEREEEVDFGGDYMGEWSSGDSGEESEETETYPALKSKKVVYKSYPTPRQSSRVQSSHPGHEEEEEEEEEEERAPPPKPSVTVKPDRKSAKPPRAKRDSKPSPNSDGSGSNPWSFLFSFLLLVVTFVVVFFAYDYYTLRESGTTHHLYIRARAFFLSCLQGKTEQDEL